ncbi:MAG: helix-turn-helix domain-containing protein [Sulfolobales archaeon]|nr:helix-turn-helix domain-containing protein [Sulfolobales archaeon]
MPKINAEKLDDQKKPNILKKSVEKHGLSYVSRFVGVDRSTLNRYLNGKIRRIPQEVVEKASELLTVDELSDVVYGLRSTDVVIHYGREDNDITEIVITPDGFVIPFETVYPKLLKDPSRVKYFYNVRKDDIRKALNKEYLDTIKRIAMKWED